MMLSFMMLPMHTVGLLLRLCGLSWRERQEHLYSVFQAPLNSFKELKLYWWPPPKSATISGMNRKKLLLTALSMALMRANAAAPPITWSADRSFLQTIKRAKGRNGMLLTARLSKEGEMRVRKSLEALPSFYFTPDEDKQLIVDTGASVTATGDMNDFIPNTVEVLEGAHPMDGIGGSLNETHKGRVRYEVITDDQRIHVLEATDFYFPELTCRLFSPQSYFLEKHIEGQKGNSLDVTWSGITLKLGPKTISVPHDYQSRLPILHCFKDAMKKAESLSMVFITDESNQNLTCLQKLLLKWH